MQQIINDIGQAVDDTANDLSGFATRAAVQQLAQNWQDAHNDGYPAFNASSVAADLDQVIAQLTALKLRVQSGLNANDANMAMRAALGLV